jgi:hypothetical protein
MQLLNECDTPLAGRTRKKSECGIAKAEAYIRYVEHFANPPQRRQIELFFAPIIFKWTPRSTQSISSAYPCLPYYPVNRNL